MNLPRIKTKDIGGSLKGLLFTLAEKAFLTFLSLFVIALIFGAIIYYQYNVLAKKEEAQTIKEPLRFQEEIYQSVSRIWQEREKKFEGADSREYLSPFKVDQIREVTPEEHSEASEGNESEESTLEEPLGPSEVEQEGIDLGGPHVPLEIDQ